MTTPLTRIEALEAEAFRGFKHQQHVEERLSFIVGALGDLSQDARNVNVTLRELDMKIDHVHHGLNTKIDRVHQRLDTKIDHVRETLRGEISALDTKIDHVHQELDSKISALDTKIDHVHETLHDEISQVRGEMRDGFAAVLATLGDRQTERAGDQVAANQDHGRRRAPSCSN